VDKPFAELDLLLGSLQILFHEHEFSGNLLRQGGGRGIAGAWQGVSMVLSTHIVFFWGVSVFVLAWVMDGIEKRFSRLVSCLAKAADWQKM